MDTSRGRLPVRQEEKLLKKPIATREPIGNSCRASSRQVLWLRARRLACGALF
jgi:hypothetical protein